MVTPLDFAAAAARKSYKPKWKSGPYNDRSTNVQQPEGRVCIPEGILRLAQTEYETQHPGVRQDYEKMQQRGGLSVNEVIHLLADLAERYGAKPTEPRRS